MQLFFVLLASSNSHVEFTIAMSIGTPPGTIPAATRLLAI
jgi:hypothetical protein